MKPEETMLYQDLNREHRDSLFRAMSFIAEHGGPPMASSELDILLQKRAACIAWVLSRGQNEELHEAYRDLREHWSPIYRD